MQKEEFFDAMYEHWCRSALNSAGALQSRDGEFRGIFTPFYTIKFRGGHKSGGARATVASPTVSPKANCLFSTICPHEE